MKVDVRELYKDTDQKYYFSVYDYQPMIDAFGKVAIQVEDNDYQGDTRVLYDNDGKIGFLVFGWGSCSGCDALQACSNYDEVQELCDELQNKIQWFASKEEALAWAKEKDWEIEFYWHEEETKEFVREIIKYLEK
jgi:hypothetical protein